LWLCINFVLTSPKPGGHSRYVQTWNGQLLHDGKFAIVYAKHNNHPNQKIFMRDLITVGNFRSNEPNKIKKYINFCSLVEWAEDGVPLIELANDGREYPFLRILVQDVDAQKLFKSVKYLASWTHFRKKSKYQSIKGTKEWNETTKPQKQKLSQGATAQSTHKILGMLFGEDNQLPFGWAWDPVNRNAIEPYIDFDNMNNELKCMLQLDFEDGI